ncbi:hypothetical protein LDENG_00233520 [Lucifuga dentata]|nr:hypothetical protein LDENG_00233520 [Lucifuga dentata]
MLAGLFLVLYFTEHVVAKNPPDVVCLMINLKYVHCSWNGQRTPDVSYSFYSRFRHGETFRKCVTYISEDGTNTGCDQPYDLLIEKRFQQFYTKLVHGNDSFQKTHDLKRKVKLNPPVNLTALNGSDGNLWFYWNHTISGCVESEVHHRINNNKWEISKLSVGRQNYCINLPSSSSRYELQVRSTIWKDCGGSDFWSDFSQPVFWGSMKENNSTDINRGSMSLLTPVLSVVGAFILILLVIMLLHHERLRIILIPIIPTPNNLKEILTNPNDEAWLHISKSHKEGFKANFNERACPTCEYHHVSQSESESSDSSTGSTFSDTTNQTESEGLSTSCSSSSSTCLAPSEEEQVS